MPSLSLFGQRTPVAGDDLRIYCFFFVLLRLSQLCASVALLIYTNEILQDQDEFIQLVEDFRNPPAIHDPLQTLLEEKVVVCMTAAGEGDVTHDRATLMNRSYLVLSIVLALAGILYAVIVQRVSACGTPTDGRMNITWGLWPGKYPDRQRTHVLQGFCHLHLTGLAAVRLTVAILGITVYSELTTFCACFAKIPTTITEWNIGHPDVPPANLDMDENFGCQGRYHELYYFLMVSHNLELVCNGVLIAFLVAKACCSSRALQSLSKKLFIPRILGSETRWRLFCRCCCTLTSVASCFLLGGKEAAFGDFTEIAILLSDFFAFHGSLDITATDMVAALLLLGQVQTQRIRDTRREVLLKTQMYKSGILNANDSLNVETKWGAPTDSESPSMRRVILNVSETKTFAGINYRLKHYTGGEWTWEAHVTKVLDPDDPTDLLTIAEGARFMRLCLAIYTWVMYSFNRPCTGCCTICCISLRRDCQEPRPEEPYFGDGRCCRLHSTSFLREAGITDETEIAYAYFHSGVVDAPHAVVLDHEWKSVVIVIRGTLSLEDVLTDLTVKPTHLEKVGKTYGFDGSNFYVHGGMLATCKWILEGFREHRTLEKLFAPESPYTNYQLRVTGHSLGGGVASILAMMLRPKYPQIKCHSFAPPGCTMSEHAAKASEEFVTAYIIDADIVPRASLDSLDNLRSDLVDVISRIKVPKNQVMEEFAGCVWGSSKDRATIVDRMLCDERERPECKFSTKWKQYRQKYDANKLKRGVHVVELFPPGKLVQLFPSNGIDDDVDGDTTNNQTCPLRCSSKSGQSEKQFSSRWANRRDFREIRISKHFVDDHLPLTVLNRLEDEAKRFALAPPYVVNLQPDSSNHSEEDKRASITVKVKSICAGVATDWCEEGIEVPC